MLVNVTNPVRDLPSPYHNRLVWLISSTSVKLPVCEHRKRKLHSWIGVHEVFNGVCIHSETATFLSTTVKSGKKLWMMKESSYSYVQFFFLHFLLCSLQTVVVILCSFSLIESTTPEPTTEAATGRPLKILNLFFLILKCCFMTWIKQTWHSS